MNRYHDFLVTPGDPDYLPSKAIFRKILLLLDHFNISSWGFPKSISEGIIEHCLQERDLLDCLTLFKDVFWLEHDHVLIRERCSSCGRELEISFSSEDWSFRSRSPRCACGAMIPFLSENLAVESKEKFQSIKRILISNRVPDAAILIWMVLIGHRWTFTEQQFLHVHMPWSDELEREGHLAPGCVEIGPHFIPIGQVTEPRWRESRFCIIHESRDGILTDTHIPERFSTKHRDFVAACEHLLGESVFVLVRQYTEYEKMDLYEKNRELARKFA
jgi:hypothetical protein